MGHWATRMFRCQLKSLHGHHGKRGKEGFQSKEWPCFLFDVGMALRLHVSTVMDAGMVVRFWGVRGSVAGTAADCAHVGGNTSCVEVGIGDTTLILDGGTGLFRLGQKWGTRPGQAAVLFSHFHWDHIQGFPFFRPAYTAGNSFTLWGPRHDGLDVEAALSRQMQPPNFPATLGAMRAQLHFKTIRPGDEFIVGAARVRAALLNHPQGCLGYRITAGPVSLVYATDTELLAGGLLDPAVVDLARNADLLIHDAQYTDDEYYGRCGPSHKGWGHSTVTAACAVARAAGVKQLVLFHHDPTHDDKMIHRFEEQARGAFINVVAAREGMAIQLLPSKVQAVAKSYARRSPSAPLRGTGPVHRAGHGNRRQTPMAASFRL